MVGESESDAGRCVRCDGHTDTKELLEQSVSPVCQCCILSGQQAASTESLTTR